MKNDLTYISLFQAASPAVFGLKSGEPNAEGFEKRCASAGTNHPLPFDMAAAALRDHQAP